MARAFLPPLVQGCAVLVNVTIAAYALALLLIAVFGGFDLGVVSFTNAAKPILMLAMMVPLRIALPADPWLMRGSAQVGSWIRGVRARVAIPSAITDALFVTVVTRSATVAVAFLANVLLTPARERAWSMPFETAKFAEIFAAFDSGWYFDIAQRGYYFSADGQSSVAFFPLYPTLMALVAAPFGGTDRAIWGAGIAISLAAFTLALCALHRLTEKLTGDRTVAYRAILYVAVFPFSLFFTRVYTESLFLLTTVLAVSRAYDGRWWAAGAWGAAATLTRPNAILIALPLGLLAMRDAPALRTIVARATPLALLPAALAGYCAYVYSLSGDPLAWLSAQTQWGYSLGHGPWQQLLKMMNRLVEHGLYGYFFVTPLAPFRLLHGTVALLFLALVPSIFRRFGVALGSYVLVSLLVPLSSNALEGVGRYAVVLFPAFMLMATAKSPRLHEAILIVSALLLALLNCLFVTLHPIY
jgi:hypothetical protein